MVRRSAAHMLHALGRGVALTLAVGVSVASCRSSISTETVKGGATRAERIRGTVVAPPQALALAACPEPWSVSLYGGTSFGRQLSADLLATTQADGVGAFDLGPPPVDSPLSGLVILASRCGLDLLRIPTARAEQLVSASSTVVAYPLVGIIDERRAVGDLLLLDDLPSSLSLGDAYLALRDDPKWRGAFRATYQLEPETLVGARPIVLPVDLSAGLVEGEAWRPDLRGFHWDGSEVNVTADRDGGVPRGMLQPLSKNAPAAVQVAVTAVHTAGQRRYEATLPVVDRYPIELPAATVVSDVAGINPPLLLAPLARLTLKAPSDACTTLSALALTFTDVPPASSAFTWACKDGASTDVEIDAPQEAMAAYVWAIDAAGRIARSAPIPIGYDPSPTTLNLSGLPSGQSNAVNLTPTVAQPTTYKSISYKVGPSASTDCADVSSYTVTRPDEFAVAIGSVPDGPIRFCATATEQSGRSIVPADAVSFSWIKDTVPPPTPTLSGAPTGSSASTALAVTVSGAGVDHYRYKSGPAVGVDCSIAGGYSQWTAIATTAVINHDLSGEPEGAMRLCVQSRDAASNVQTVAAVGEWTKDTIAPVAALSGLPNQESNDEQPTLQVASSGVATYRYKVGTDAALDCAVAAGYGAVINVAVASAVDVSALPDGSVAVCVVATDEAGNAQAYAAATRHDWLKDTSPPAVTLVEIEAGAANTSKSPVDVRVVATDPGAGRIHGVCLKRLAAPAPGLSDDCWRFAGVGTLVATPPAGTVDFPKLLFKLGLSAATYDVHAFVRDVAGNVSSLSAAGAGTLGVDKAQIAFTPGQPAQFKRLVVANTSAPSSDPPPISETTFSGGPITVKWRLEDNESLSSQTVKLDVVEEGGGILSWAILPAEAASGCTLDDAGTAVDDDMTGCFQSPNSPTAPFTIRLSVVDAENLIATARSGVMNGNGLRILAGNMDQGVGGSAAAAVYFHDAVQTVAPDANNFLVGSDGRIYIRDQRLGLLVADGYNDELRVLLRETGTRSGDGGPLSAATAVDVGQIAFDHLERVLVYDHDRIRRIDMTLSTPTIATIIGGGASTADTVAATSLQIAAPLSSRGSRSLDLFVTAPDGKTYFMTDPALYVPLAQVRVRVYDPQTSMVSSLRFAGTGDSLDAGQDVGPCWASDLALRFDKATGSLLDLFTTQYHHHATPLCPSATYGFATTRYDAGGTSAAPHPPLPLGIYQQHTGYNGQMYGGREFALSKFDAGTNAWTLLIGDGTAGECPDGTDALSCRITAGSYFIDALGTVYFMERGRIRMIDDDGKVVTVLGQSLSSGDGGPGSVARFAEIRNLGLADDGEIVASDIRTARLRAVSPTGVVSTIAGNGTAEWGGTTLPATSQGIYGESFGNDLSFALDPATGDVFYARDTYLARLVRATGIWSDLNGLNAPLTGYATADGQTIDRIQSGYYPPIAYAFANDKLLVHWSSYQLLPTTMHFDAMIKSYDAADSWRQAHVIGSIGTFGNGSCAAGTATTACAIDIGIGTGGTGYSEPQFEASTGRWLFLRAGGTVIRSVPIGAGVVQDYLTLPRAARTMALEQSLDLSTNKVHYCAMDGRLYTYDQNTASETALPWPSPAMTCSGMSLKYDPAADRLLFPVTRDGLSGLAEWQF